MMPEDWDGIPAGAENLFDVSVHDEMLRSTVRMARLAFGASAASVFLYDADHDQLVFEASSGAGEDRLVGVRISANRGIAGWVWNTGETIIVRDLASDARFDRKFAEETGYVPDEIMAAPLEIGGETIGVIEVLDARAPISGDIAALDLLAEIASHCSTAISLVRAARSIRPSLLRKFRTEPLMRLDAALSKMGGAPSTEFNTLVTALANIIENPR